MKSNLLLLSFYNLKSVNFRMPHYPDEIEYSDKYMDDHYEYRHVILPKKVYKALPRGRLLTEHVIIHYKLGMEIDGSTTIPRMGSL